VLPFYLLWNLGTLLWAFCLILFFGIALGPGQPLEDSSNCTHPLTTPSPESLPQIKSTEVILAITLPKWTNGNNRFIYMSSVKPNFCQKPQETFLLCKTSFYQCIPPTWTSTYAQVCTAHGKQSIFYCPSYDSSHQEGHPTYLPFHWAKNN
jgi:hypothetical protein